MIMPVSHVYAHYSTTEVSSTECCSNSCPDFSLVHKIISSSLVTLDKQMDHRCYSRNAESFFFSVKENNNTYTQNVPLVKEKRITVKRE